ncbi:hypothetical protein [Undibacter mobilis]|uniref:DUF2306 domain-containing protein n=1 Tax=Undibacter mobilis TaxID=2292256 RepID=A0A371BC02_9BRAD|nr:hypothetical protein [Undibacter mobilis]RDV05080.1 hypothetical protein DXH78_11195 [Undibacter mobilis]
MVLGLSIPTFTVIHVIISLVAIASGLVVVFGMIGSHRLPKLTALFWVMTVLTTVTGFMFFLSPTQAKVLTPAAATGLVATVFFVLGLIALYGKHLYGRWRWIYAICVTISLYLNVFVLFTQSFQKLKIINPAGHLTSTVGPPFGGSVDFHFAVAQGAALLIFVMLGVIAAWKFRRGPGLV